MKTLIGSVEEGRGRTSSLLMSTQNAEGERGDGVKENKRRWEESVKYFVPEERGITQREASVHVIMAMFTTREKRRGRFPRNHLK